VELRRPPSTCRGTPLLYTPSRLTVSSPGPSSFLRGRQQQQNKVTLVICLLSSSSLVLIQPVCTVTMGNSLSTATSMYSNYGQ